MAGAAQVGKHQSMRELALARIARRFDMSLEKTSSFFEDLQGNNWSGMSASIEKRLALAELVGKGRTTAVTRADVALGRTRMSQMFSHQVQQAERDLSRVLSDRYAGQLRSFEDFRGLAGFSGTYQDLKHMIKSREYAQLAILLSNYANPRGIDLERAAIQLGKLAGEKQSISLEGFEGALATVGSDRLQRAEVNRILNEAAKFEQTYQFAKSLGYAGSRDDFSGMYKGHLAHHAQETWTLLDETAVDRLNKQIEAQGLDTRFDRGDRVSMAITEDGRITLVKGAAGASREELDLSSISTGGRLDFYDDAAVYHGGFRSNYSPTQTVAYSTMRAIFDDDAAAQQATAIIWNSAQEGRFWGSFATDPRSWVGAVTLGTIDAGHRGLKKVFSDNDLMGRIKDRFLPSTKTEVYIDDWIGP